MSRKVNNIVMVIATMYLVYAGVAFLVFQWRNPLCNQMAFYRDHVAVITFQKLDCYQGR